MSDINRIYRHPRSRKTSPVFLGGKKSSLSIVQKTPTISEDLKVMDNNEEINSIPKPISFEGYK